MVLVPFPFTDQSGLKKRPAVVVSSSDYCELRRDIVIMAITSQVRQPLAFAEAMIVDWQGAGLIKASVFKPVYTTIEQGLVTGRWAHCRGRCQGMQGLGAGWRGPTRHPSRTLSSVSDPNTDPFSPYGTTTSTPGCRCRSSAASVRLASSSPCTSRTCFGLVCMRPMKLSRPD